MNVRDMVLQRRLDYGFNGYQVPVVPRASRSARGRGPIKKKCEDKQKRAFEILASVAGKLLLESESSGCSNAACAKDQDNIVKNHDKWEQEDQRRLLYANPCEKEICDEKTFACVPGMRGHRQSYTLNECSHMQDNFGFNINLTSDNRSEKTSFPEKLATVNSRNAFGSPSSKVGGDSTRTGEYFASLVGGVIERKVEAEPSIIRNHKQGTLPFRGSLDDRTELERKPPAVVCSESNVKASLFRDCITPGSVSRHYDNVKVVSRDDDENSVGCTHPSAMVKAYRPLPDIIDRRIRNLSASKCWRLAPNLFGTDGKAKPVYRKVRTCYGRQRSQRISSFKRRKFFDRSPLSKSNGRFRFEGIFNSPHKRSNGDNCVASAKLNAIGGSTPVAGQQAPPRSGDCNVKLSIKSFKVPELFVEIPATATVGSLKRTVMEAVTAILGDGLHVGVLLRGKKVRDDSKTLLQTGISQDDKHRSLGFMLEPRHAQIMPPPCTEDRLLPGGTPQGHTKQTASPVLQPGTSNISQIPPVMNLDSCVETDLKAVPLLADTSTNNAMPQSQTLVAVPAISMEALAMVPLHRKSGHPEYIQRRIRRPFSVSEVEALVQAVEELGTGRWRDVKLRAFENANYRTYVDLKDKWKTLVHTARISPQQRRGEPVPQELLDRVLAADSYWSQQQAKHQVKSTSLRLCL